jgi:tetratricopeptide (TPR) repeat protein
MNDDDDFGFDENEDDDFDEELQELIADYEATIEADGMKFWAVDDWLEIITHYVYAFKPNKSLEAARFAVAQHPYNSEIYIRLAQTLMLLQELEQAHDALDTAALYAPEDLTIDIVRAKVLIEEKKYDEALAIIDRLRAIPDLDEYDRERIAITEAGFWYEQKDFDNTFDNLYIALECDPRSYLATAGLGLVLEELSDPNTALALLQKISDKDPYASHIWLAIATLQERLNLIDDAIESYELAVLGEDGSEVAYHFYIDFLFKHKRFAQARIILQEASETEQLFSETELLLKLGKSWQGEGELVQALNHYKRALALSPDSSDAYFFMGELYLELNMLTEAREALATAIKMSEKNAHYAATLAKTLATLGQKEEALHYFALSVKLLPQDIEYWAEYLAFLLKESDFEAAAEVIADMESQSFDEAWIKYAEAALSLCQKYFQEGIAQLLMALELDSSNHDILFLMSPELEKNTRVLSTIQDFLADKRDEDLGLGEL